jgi:hypothetical protein
MRLTETNAHSVVHSKESDFPIQPLSGKISIALLIIFIVMCSHLYAQPRINSITPANGALGAEVTLEGTGFSSNAADNLVRFGGVKAQVLSASATMLRVTAPAGAAYQPVTVTTGNLSGRSRLPFVIRHTASGNEFVSNSFGRQFLLPAGAKPTNNMLGDMDGDGRLDLVYGLDHIKKLRIMKNITSGSTPDFELLHELDIDSLHEIRAIEDMDGDGKLDLITLSYYTSVITLYRNTSDGSNISFASPVTINPSSSTGITVADINGDGKPDIINANYGDFQKSITVYLNTGSTGVLQFTESGKYGGSSGSIDICNGDFNGDGKVDIAVASIGQPGGVILQNTTTGGIVSFTVFSNFLQYGSYASFSVLPGDFNQDGKPDLAFSTLGRVRILVNNSTPDNMLFTESVTPPSTSGASYYLGVGDVNGDGISDMVTGNTGQGLASLSILGASPGSFTGFLPSATYNLPSAPVGVTIGDINNDGRSDIVLSNLSQGTISVIVNGLSPISLLSFEPLAAAQGDTVRIKGTGFFMGISSVSFGGMAASSFAVQSDSTLYGIVASGASGEIAITGSKGSAQLAGFSFIPAPIVSSFSPLNASPAAWIDIYGSHFNNVDSVIIGQYLAPQFEVLSSEHIRAMTPVDITGGLVQVFARGGKATHPGFYNGLVLSGFSPASGLPGTELTIEGLGFEANAADNIVLIGSIRAQVISGTGSQLKVLVPASAVSGPVQIITKGRAVLSGVHYRVVFSGAEPFVNAGTFAPRQEILLASGTEILQSADVNGDELPDMAICYYAGTIIRIYPNRTTGDSVIFGQPFLLNFSESVREFIWADLNLDGKQDLLVLTDNLTYIYQNSSTTTNLSFTEVYQMGTTGVSLHVTDMDKDGLPDLVLRGIGIEILVLRNLMNGSKWDFERFEFGEYHDDGNQRLLVGDIDLDGYSDVLSTREDGMIGILRNQSSPGKVVLVDDGILEWPGFALYSFSLEDFDLDGLPDLFISRGTSSDNTALFKNLSVPGTIAFSEGTEQGLGFYAYKSISGDFNGDGRPDMAGVIGNDEGPLTVLGNKDQAGMAGFAFAYEGGTHPQPRAIVSGDFNADGKPDLIVAGNSTRLNVFLNRTNVSTNLTVSLCPNSSIAMASSITGSSYQWQMSTDSGVTFSNVPPDEKHTGTDSPVLQVTDIPSAWYGRIYRCLADGVPGKMYTLKFTNIWQAEDQAFWSSAYNWSCGSIPDANTDVLLKYGRIVVGITGAAVCRTLSVSPGAILMVQNFANLIISK